ncbi:MAG: hypothetical protein HC888_14190, partial [Candidatus Competibacteraceae bacterium]|nr:hypothetical protein [Candidatus Competibacteraceae bacterium]
VAGMSFGCLHIQAFQDPFFDAFFDDSTLFGDELLGDLQKRFKAIDDEMRQMRRVLEKRRKSVQTLEKLEQQIAPHTMMMHTEDTPEAYSIKLVVDEEVRREDIKVSLEEGKLHITVPGKHTTDIVVTPKMFACQVRKVTDEKTGDMRQEEQKEISYEHIISQQVMSLPVRLDLSRDPNIVLNRGELVISFPKAASRAISVQDGTIKQAEKGDTVPAIDKEAK